MHSTTSRITLFGFIIMSTALITSAIIFFTPLRYTEIIEPTITEISPQEFYEDYSENEDGYLFIDVRPVSYYNDKHAEGSINIPLYLLYDERHNLPRSGKEIVLICSGNRTSGVAFSYLQHYGFTNIKRVTGGIEAWEAAGLPTARTDPTVTD